MFNNIQDPVNLERKVVKYFPFDSLLRTHPIPGLTIMKLLRILQSFMMAGTGACFTKELMVTIKFYPAHYSVI
jgi:hypothetical protein